REAVRIERERRPRVDRRQLLEDEGAREGAEVLGAGETEAGELAHQPARHAAGPLVGAQPRQQAVAGEAARRVLDQALLVGEREAEHAALLVTPRGSGASCGRRSEEHTSELQSRFDLVCRLLLEKKKKKS